MKKVLLIAGIAIIALGLLSICAGLMFWFVRTHTLDASNSFYDMQKKMMIIHMIIGAACTVVGTIGVIVSKTVIS